MNCQTFEQYLVDYLEGTLSQEQTRDADAHLQQCDQCQVLLAQEQTISAKIRQLPTLSCPKSVLERVFDRIEEEQRFLSWRERLQWWFVNHHLGKIGMTAAAIVVFVMIGIFYQGGDNPPVSPGTYSEEELKQAQRDIELTLAYVNDYAQQTGNIVEEQLALAHIAVTQPIQTLVAEQILFAIKHPLETNIKDTFISLDIIRNSIL